jgi:hypothetical protein
MSPQQMLAVGVRLFAIWLFLTSLSNDVWLLFGAGGLRRLLLRARQA